MVRVAQINLGGSPAAISELEFQFSQGKFDVAMIQEPGVNKGIIRGLSGGKLYYQRGDKDNKPRACIWVSRALAESGNCQGLTNLTTLDEAVITLKVTIGGDKKEIIIASIYAAGDRQMISENMEKIMQFSRSSRKEIIFAGDFNAHHVAWGSDTNKRGIDLVEWIAQTDLDLMNQGNVPTWARNWSDVNSSQTHIDLTFASINISQNISKWRVNQGVAFSDHRAIYFEIEAVFICKQIRNRKKTDYKGFLEELKKKDFVPIKITNKAKLDTYAWSLNQLILQAFYKNCKFTKCKSKNLKPWVTKELVTSKRELNKKWRKFIQRSTQGNREAYDNHKKKYDKLVAKLKADSWVNKASELENIDEISRLQKFFEKGRGTEINSIVKDDFTFTESLEETLEYLITHHFPNCVEINEQQVEESRPTQLLLARDRADINSTFTNDVIEKVIDNFGPYKSPGADEIFPALLQQGKEIIVPHLVNLFKASVSFSYIPKVWRGTKVIFIPKPGKNNYSEPGAYRPISLMSFILKALEKVIDSRIRNVNLIERPLDTSQHAYQPGKSTESALHEMFTYTEKAIYQEKGFAVGVFIDFKGAFDKTNTQVMLNALRNHNVESWIIEWFKAMLENRDIQAFNDTSTKHFRPVMGCPQGSCSGPLLWSVVIDGLIKLLKNKKIKVIAYADDLIILAKGIDLKEVCMKINDAMKEVSDWCKEFKLEVSTEKSKMMCFTNKREATILKGIRAIWYEGEIIERVREFKYLGLYLDPKINMNVHIKMICSKALRSLWATRAMVKRNWGLSPEKMIWIYKQIILPRVTYGSVVWWSRTHKTNTAMLDKIQRFALLLASGSMKSTPTQSLNVIFNILPIDLHIKSIALKTFSRLSATSNWQIGANNTPHGKIAGKCNEIIIVNEYDLIRRTVMPVRKFKIEINERTNWDKGVEFINNPIKWFSDGSKRGDRTAAGVYCPDIVTRNNRGIRRSVRLSDFATIAQAELIAIEECANYCNNMRITNRNIIFHSDSQAAIMGLRRNDTQSRTIMQTFRAINRVAEHNSVYLYWSPGHVGIVGNERADYLANRGIEREQIDITTKTPSSFIKSEIDKHIFAQFNRRWHDVNELRFSKIMMPNVCAKRADIVMKMSRRNLRIAVGILTGFCCFKWFLKVIKKSNSGNCRFCNDPREDMAHILGECEAIQAQRFRTTGKHDVSREELGEIEVSDWMRFLRIIKMDETFFKVN